MGPKTMSERKRSSKIEKLGLAERILDFNKQGWTSEKIADKLKEEGVSIDQSTISRWLKNQRETAQPEAARLVREHVKKTVPADLDALEEMEAKCLEWAREDNLNIAHRLTAQFIDSHFEQWADIIQKAAIAKQNQDNKYIKDVVRTIMRQCLLWIADDIALQKKAIAAMRMASQIIDLKLRYSGILDGPASGNIFFTDQSPDSSDEPQLEGEKKNLFVLKGSKNESHG